MAATLPGDRVLDGTGYSTRDFPEATVPATEAEPDPDAFDPDDVQVRSRRRAGSVQVDVSESSLIGAENCRWTGMFVLAET